jgi:hypothetical protein
MKLNDGLFSVFITLLVSALQGGQLALWCDIADYYLIVSAVL